MKSKIAILPVKCEDVGAYLMFGRYWIDDEGKNYLYPIQKSWVNYIGYAIGICTILAPIVLLFWLFSFLPEGTPDPSDSSAEPPELSDEDTPRKEKPAIEHVKPRPPRMIHH